MPVVRTEGGEDYTGATVIEPEKGFVPTLCIRPSFTSVCNQTTYL